MTAPKQPPGWPGRDRPLIDSPLGDLIAGRIDQAEYQRRMAEQTHERRAVRLDPDPLYVPPEPIRRVRLCRDCGDLLEGPIERRREVCIDCDGRGGNAVGIITLLLALVAAIAIVWLYVSFAAPRSGSADLTRPALTGASPASPGTWPASAGVVPPASAVPGKATPGSRGAEPTTELGPPLLVYRGTAVWYCSDGRGGSPVSDCPAGYGPDDRVAAIDRKDSEFRKGDRVLVTYGEKSVVVLIVDTCKCADARVIDLTIGAFEELAPWGLGVLPVTLQDAGLPATTTDGSIR